MFYADEKGIPKTVAEKVWLDHLDKQSWCSNLFRSIKKGKIIRVDIDRDLLLVWEGGTGIHAYDATGKEVDYWMIEDVPEEKREAEIIKSMEERISGAEQYLLLGNPEGESAQVLRERRFHKEHDILVEKLNSKQLTEEEFMRAEKELERKYSIYEYRRQ